MTIIVTNIKDVHNNIRTRIKTGITLFQKT